MRNQIGYGVDSWENKGVWTLHLLTRTHPHHLPSELGSPAFPFAQFLTAAWNEHVEGWDLMILQVFSNLNDSMILKQGKGRFPIPPALLHFPQARTEP